MKVLLTKENRESKLNVHRRNDLNRLKLKDRYNVIYIMNSLCFGRMGLLCQVADRRGVGVWERDTWVEQMQSYPSAVTGIIKAAPITRFIVSLVSFNLI